jgi:hypothetical protein
LVGTTNQKGENIPKGPHKYQRALNYSKIAIKVPYGREIRRHFSSQGLLKYTKSGNFGMENIYHLAIYHSIIVTP